MTIKSIARGFMMIELDWGDAALLARALEEGDYGQLAGDADTAVRAMGAAFESAALAAFMQGASTAEHITLATLRERTARRQQGAHLHSA
jgi:hypothetical protein